MITLEEFLEAIEYKITGGHDYHWDSFGDSAYVIESELQSQDGKYAHTVLATFDKETKEVYLVEAWDYTRVLEYRWISPEFVEDYKIECESKGVSFDNSIDDKKFIDLEVPEDILQKVTAIVNEEDYDQRVIVPLTIGEENEILLMRLAHEVDLSLNQYVEKILREEIERHNGQV